MHSSQDASDIVVDRRLLRLGLASVALTFMQARQELELEDLMLLVERRLLTASEASLLERHMTKAPAQVLWAWIAHIFTVASSEDRIGDQKLWWLHQKCTDARGCIGLTFAYLDSQLPLAYIHLLGVLVKVTLFVMAAEVRKQTTGMSPCQHRSLQRSCPGGRDLGGLQAR